MKTYSTKKLKGIGQDIFLNHWRTFGFSEFASERFTVVVSLRTVVLAATGTFPLEGYIVSNHVLIFFQKLCSG